MSSRRLSFLSPDRGVLSPHHAVLMLRTYLATFGSHRRFVKGGHLDQPVSRLVVLTEGKVTIELWLTVTMPVLRAASQQAFLQSKQYRRVHSMRVVMAAKKGMGGRGRMGFCIGWGGMM